jgi:tetratricopeptide (TPR) repeat protein
MSAKWAKKGKEVDVGSAPVSADKPERISNKLDHVLVAQSKRGPIFSLSRLRRHKRAVIVVLVLALALLLIVGGTYIARYFNRKSLAEQQGKDFQALVVSVKDLRNRGKDGQAHSKLLGFNNKYPNQTKEQRYRVGNELAEIYKTLGDFKNATKWQQTAFDNNPNPGYSDYLALGEAYTLNRNNAQAIKYLQLALDEMKSEEPNGDGGARGRFIQYQIDLLKGQKQ